MKNRQNQKSLLLKAYEWAKGWWYLWVVLPLMFCPSCANTLPETVEFPTAIEAATAATNLTDVALVAAMTVAKPSKVELALVWEPRVQVVDDAYTVVKLNKDLCEVLPKLRTVAVAISCEECVKVVKSAERQAKCQ